MKKSLLITILMFFQVVVYANDATLYTVVCNDEKDQTVVKMVYDYCIGWMGPKELSISGVDIPTFMMEFQDTNTKFYSDDTDEVVFEFSIPSGDDNAWATKVELGSMSVETICNMTESAHSCE